MNHYDTVALCVAVLLHAYLVHQSKKRHKPEPPVVNVHPQLTHESKPDRSASRFI